MIRQQVVLTVFWIFHTDNTVLTANLSPQTASTPGFTGALDCLFERFVLVSFVPDTAIFNGDRVCVVFSETVWNCDGIVAPEITQREFHSASP